MLVLDQWLNPEEVKQYFENFWEVTRTNIFRLFANNQNSNPRWCFFATFTKVQYLNYIKAVVNPHPVMIRINETNSPTISCAYLSAVFFYICSKCWIVFRTPVQHVRARGKGYNPLKIQHRIEGTMQGCVLSSPPCHKFINRERKNQRETPQALKRDNTTDILYVTCSNFMTEVYKHTHYFIVASIKIESIIPPNKWLVDKISLQILTEDEI